MDIPTARIRAAASAGITALALAALSQQASAEGVAPFDHDHAPLPVDTALTLAEVVDRTLENDPGYAELAARQSQADAWQDRGGSWFAGQPAVAVRYQTDRWDEDVGLREIESGIQFALWRWGERRSARDYGRTLEAEAHAAAPELRWEVAGFIRRLVWQIAEAEAELELAEQAESVAARLAASVQRRHELGDVARRDVLLARSTELAATAGVAEAQAALTDAERTYRTVTGLGRRPAIAAESMADSEQIDAGHPAMQAAVAAVERSEAARQLARESGAAPPTLTVGPRRERSNELQDYEDSIGIQLSIPFGGRSHRQTEVAAAGREVAAAEARYRATARQLELAMHEAAHSLAVARQNLSLAAERADLAGQGYEMGEVAYSRGEIGLVELLNLGSVSLDANRQAVRFQIEVNRQIALYNQAVGVMP